MYTHKNTGFSLVELMVTIAIVAILAAVAVPSYNAYVTRTKVANIMSLGQDITSRLIVQHQTTGTWPSSFVWGGYTFSPMAGASGANISTPTLNDQGIAQIQVGVNTTTDQTRVQFITTGLRGIPNYTGGTGGAGTYNIFTIEATSERNGAVEYRCGTGAAGDSFYIPIEFMPSECKCTGLNAYYGNPAFGDHVTCQ